MWNLYDGVYADGENINHRDVFKWCEKQLEKVNDKSKYHWLIGDNIIDYFMYDCEEKYRGLYDRMLNTFMGIEIKKTYVANGIYLRTD